MSEASLEGKSPEHFWGCAIFSASLMFLYLASTLFHRCVVVVCFCGLVGVRARCCILRRRGRWTARRTTRRSFFAAGVCTVASGFLLRAVVRGVHAEERCVWFRFVSCLAVQLKREGVRGVLRLLLFCFFFWSRREGCRAPPSISRWHLCSTAYICLIVSIGSCRAPGFSFFLLFFFAAACLSLSVLCLFFVVGLCTAPHRTVPHVRDDWFSIVLDREPPWYAPFGNVQALHLFPVN